MASGTAPGAVATGRRRRIRFRWRPVATAPGTVPLLLTGSAEMSALVERSLIMALAKMFQTTRLYNASRINLFLEPQLACRLRVVWLAEAICHMPYFIWHMK